MAKVSIFAGIAVIIDTIGITIESIFRHFAMARRRKITVSKAEKEILAWLCSQGFRKGIDVIPQFKIEGVPMVFDFLFPKIKLILEYQ